MKQRFLLLNQAGGLGDGGGNGGAGDPPANSDGGTGGGQGADDTGTGGESTFTGPEWAKGWEGVEADVLNDPALKAIQNPASLVKSYVHAQRQLGKKGVMIPSENSPKEEWDQFYQKVGVPLEEQKYKEALKFTDHSKFGDEINNGFLKLAHEARLRPDQAQKAYEFFDTQIKAGADKHQQEMATRTQAELDNLMNEMGGEAYNVKLNKTVAFLQENVGKDFIQYLGDSGLGRNAQVVKALMTITDKYTKEGEIPRGDSLYGMTLNDLEREVNMAYDPKDPYMNSKHPDHQRRVDEILSYNKKIDQLRAQK